MASFTPTPLQWGKVVGRFVALRGDGGDADVYPDAIPLSGTVTFAASPTQYTVTDATPDPLTVFPQPIVAVIDINGYLSYNGAAGVWLTATNDSTTNPTGFSYTVTYNLSFTDPVTNQTSQVSQRSYSISVPASDPYNTATWTDLAKAAPVVASNGVITTVGPAGPVTDLTIGTVTTGSTPSATITGTAPSKVLNLVLPNAVVAAGTITSINTTLTPDSSGNVNINAISIPGLLDTNNHLLLTLFPDLTNALPSSMVYFVREHTGTYGPRPTARTDQMVLWFGPDSPTVVESGTAGMLDGVDSWFQTVS